MSLNSSTPERPPHPFFPYLNMLSFLDSCFNSPVGALSITALTLTNVVLPLPLCVLVLYLGLQRRRQRRSDAPTSHFDFFSYNMAAMEVMGAVGNSFMSCGIRIANQPVMIAGFYLYIINMTGQSLIHILTCVERYLAVVHPVTYRNLRLAHGKRRVVIGCVWLLCITGAATLLAGGTFKQMVVYCGLLAVIILAIFFCSLSVVCALFRPGPAGGGGGRARLDQSKLRAFQTILCILGVLLLRFLGKIVCGVLLSSADFGAEGTCIVLLSFFWFCLPSSLISPLLYVYKAGKLPCRKNRNEVTN